MPLPPLNALRAFEAAARHEGFIGASDELHVTRGAISRHVRQLEDHLGVQLFVRQAKGVRLTNAGRQLLPALSEAFALIRRETDRLTADTGDLRIICPPATSIRWLIPRLEDFRRAHPDIRVRLTTDFHGHLGFDMTEFDIGFSCEHWPTRAPDIVSETLFPVYLTPACAPALLAGKPRFDTPQDLARHVLLHETSTHLDWRDWLEAFSVTGVDPASGDDFPNLDIAAKAAVMGTGIVMGDIVLCREEFEGGTLVMPLPDMVCPSPMGGISILGPRDKWHEPKVAAFRSWAATMAARDCDYLAGLNLDVTEPA
ncbi:MAG: LysR substrate-binding domain-containing protein [Roseovarius sp.]|uniref:LysR substrate-binding domain-containing protein n=1 Tax=Roseovarius sp. TaxID=1486281 RepID=UPI0032ECDA90